ncbi:acyl-CoA synthetase [Neoconidiobolus thromboides FSU 785]|nr:acyl-CoA synthetase [Neoconidiobolus thromboides FSU 785]
MSKLFNLSRPLFNSKYILRSNLSIRYTTTTTTANKGINKDFNFLSNVDNQYPLKESYVKGESSPSLRNITIGQLWDEKVKQYPNNLAMISYFEDIKWSYQELDEKVNELMRGLVNLNLNKGDRLAVYMPNSSAWITLQYATAKLGIILVTLNPAYRSHELKQALKLIQVNAIVTIPEYKTTNYLDLIREIIPEIEEEGNDKEINSSYFPYLKRLIMVDDLIPQENKVKLPKNIIKYKDLLLKKDAELDNYINLLQTNLNTNDVINIQFTSGTTGLPKGVALTHHNILNNGYYIGKNQNLTENSVVCIPVPLYHCFGLVLGNMAVLNHASSVLYPSPSFDPVMTLKAAEKYKADAMYGVPTMFISMLSHPNFKTFDLSSLRTGIMAGSSCPEKIMEKVISEMGMKEVTICYGMTETSPVSFQSLSNDHIKLRVETVGKILPHVQAKVVDVQDPNFVLPPNQKGKLLVKGYLVMKGYWNNSEATNQILNQEGWLDTGDLAIIDENGYAKIVGRVKDMVIRGGENIYPIEVENLLFQHPKIQNISIVGVPDEKFGEQLCACYTLNEAYLNEDRNELEKELKLFCKQKLAHFKVPFYFWNLEQFPTTANGKIQKHTLREWAINHFKL